MAKSETDLEQEIKSRNKFLFIQRQCQITDTELRFFPFIISEFHCDTEKNKSPKTNKAYVIINGVTGRKKAYPDLEKMETQEMEIENQQLTPLEIDIEKENLEAIRYLKFTVLPKIFHSFQDYEIRLLSTKLIYRPVWLVKWINEKGAQKYSAINADIYNI